MFCEARSLVRAAFTAVASKNEMGLASSNDLKPVAGAASNPGLSFYWQVSLYSKRATTQTLPIDPLGAKK
jgi:hypothetical protein